MQRGVLRPVGVLLTSVCVVALGWGAAGAATRRAVFDVTLTATLAKDWTVSRSTARGECTETVTSTGQWRMSLATRRTSRLAFASAGRGRPLRISPAVVRTIAATASQTGSVRTLSRGAGCDGSLRRVCPRPRASVRGATARLTSPRRGVARFAPLQRARAVRFGGACPEQPAEVRALRTDLGLADAPLSASDLFGRNVPRFFISGNSTQETTIEGEYDGKVTERARWTLTFTRVR